MEEQRDRWIEALQLMVDQVKRNDRSLHFRFQYPDAEKLSSFELSRHMDLDHYDVVFAGEYEFMNGISIRDGAGNEIDPESVLLMGEDNPDMFLEHINEPMNAIRNLYLQEASEYVEQGYIIDLKAGDDTITFRGDMHDGLHILVNDEDVRNGRDGHEINHVREMIKGHEKEINQQLATAGKSIDTLEKIERYMELEQNPFLMSYYDKQGKPHTMSVTYDRERESCNYFIDGRHANHQAAFNVMKTDPAHFQNCLNNEVHFLAMANSSIEIAQKSRTTRQQTFGQWVVSYVYNPNDDHVRVFANIDTDRFRADNGLQEITRGELAKIIQQAEPEFVNMRSEELKELKDKVFKGELVNGKEINSDVLKTFDYIERNREEELLGLNLTKEEKAASSEIDDVGNVSINDGKPIFGVDAQGRNIVVMPETDATRNIKDGFVGYDIFVDGKQYNYKQVVRDPDLVDFLDEKQVDLQYINDLKNQALENGESIDYSYMGKDGKEHNVHMFMNPETGEFVMEKDGKPISTSDLLSDRESMNAAKTKYGPTLGQKARAGALKGLKKSMSKTIKTAERGVGTYGRWAVRSLEQSISL